MCHSRFTDKLARFAARPFPDHFLRQLTLISAAPEDHDLLHAANAPLLPGSERYYHLDGSRDTSRGIAFLAGDGRRSHLLGIPLGLADPETQHDIVSVSLLRRRIWLNGGRGEGQDEDFRFVVDGRGTWIVRLRSGDTPPDSAIGSPSDEDGEYEAEGAEEYTNLLDIPDVLPRDLRSSQSGAFRLTSRQLRNQRRRVANTRLYDIRTRINILHGIPHASTRLPSQFIRSLNDIQHLADKFRRFPGHLVSEETLAMFDRVLDQLERTASVEDLALRGQGHSTEDEAQSEPEQQTTDWLSLDTAESSERSSSPTTAQDQQHTSPLQSPRPSSPSQTLPKQSQPPPPKIQTNRLRTIVSSLETMLASPDLPPRHTFSSVRRAFDEITSLLEHQTWSSDEPPDAEVLDLAGTAQRLFWALARRAFPGTEAELLGSTTEGGRARRASKRESGKEA